MKASELLEYIRSELSVISDYTSEIGKMVQRGREEKPDLPAYLRDYNYSAFKEICDHDGIYPDFEIDSSLTGKFTGAVNRYLDTYAPGDEDLKVYVLNISLYLTFIAKRPLHPPALTETGQIEIIQKGRYYYCSEKSRYVHDSSALCRYCVCRPL